MFKRIAVTLESDLATSATLPIGFIDRITLADDGHRLFVGETRYDSPDDFTVEILNAKGDAQITWLNAATLVEGDEILLGIAHVDSITSGDVTSSGGGGGGAITSVDLGTKAEAAATTDAGTFSLIALFKRAMGKWTAMVAALGVPSEAAWTTGDMTLIGGIKRLATQALGGNPTIVVQEAPSYTYIAASSTDSAAGNANDLIDSVLVVPTSKSPGAVSFEDGAGTNYTLFAGGADSLTTLIPFPVDLRNIPMSSVGEFTTGTGLAIFVFYRPRT